MPTKDASSLYSSTLEQLNRILVAMLSPEWDASLQEATPAQRRAALRELLAYSTRASPSGTRSCRRSRRT